MIGRSEYPHNTGNTTILISGLLSSKQIVLAIGSNGTTLSDVLDAFNEYNTGDISFSAEYINSADGTEGLTGTAPIGSPGNPFTGGLATGVAGITASDRDPLIAYVDIYNERIVLEAISTDTLTEIKAVLDAVEYTIGLTDYLIGTANVVIIGSGSDTAADVYFAGLPGNREVIDFRGGVDPVGLGAVLDKELQTLTITYNEEEDNLDRLIEALELASPVSASLIYGSDGALLPELPGFTRPFRGDSIGGVGGVHATIFQEADTAKGLEIQLGEDASWALITENRLEGTAAQATDSVLSDDAANFVEITLPATLAEYSEGNDWALRVEEGRPAVVAADGTGAASGTFSVDSTTPTSAGIRFTFNGPAVDTIGDLGNDWEYTVNGDLVSTTASLTIGQAGQRITINVGVGTGVLLSDVYNDFISHLNFGLIFSVEYINSADGTEEIVSTTGAIDNFSGGLATGTAPVTARARDPLAANIDVIDQEILLEALETDTLAQIKVALDAATFSVDGATHTLGTTSSVIVYGTGSDTGDSFYFGGNPGIQTVTPFGGGIDPEPLGASLDDEAKTLTVLYASGVDDLDAMVAIIDGLGGVSAVLLYSTDGADFPETAGFTRGFRGAGGSGIGPHVEAIVSYADPALFIATIGETTLVNPTTTAINVLALTTAGILIDRGGIATIDAGTNSLQELVIDAPGTYEIAFSLYNFETAGANRAELFGSLVQIRAGVSMPGSIRTFFGYNRGTGGSLRSYISGTAIYDMEAGDSIELRLSEGFTTATVFTIGGLDSFIQISPVLGAASVQISGGSFGVKGWIEPKPAYGIDDLHKFVIVNGVECRIEVDYHAGHARAVEFQILADIGTALSADGGEVSTGDAGNFRGWFRRAGDIPTADRTDGAWYCARNIGDFEIQDPAGGHTSERWVGYDPFESGEPWASIANVDGDTIPHVPFIAANGAVENWRVARTFTDAWNAASAVGQTFTVLGDFEVLIVTEFTAHADEDASYRPEPWIAPGSSAQRSVEFWGDAQTEKLPDTLIDRGDWVITGRMRLRFNAEDPDKEFNGGGLGITCIDVADVPTTANLLPGELAQPAQAWFDVPAGHYGVRLIAVSNHVSSPTGVIHLVAHRALVDDRIIGAVRPNLAATAVLFVTGTVAYIPTILYEEIDYAEAQLLTFLVGGASTTDTLDDWAFYVQFTRLD